MTLPSSSSCSRTPIIRHLLSSILIMMMLVMSIFTTSTTTTFFVNAAPPSCLIECSGNQTLFSYSNCDFNFPGTDCVVGSIATAPIPIVVEEWVLRNVSVNSLPTLPTPSFVVATNAIDFKDVNFYYCGIDIELQIQPTLTGKSRNISLKFDSVIVDCPLKIKIGVNESSPSSSSFTIDSLNVEFINTTFNAPGSAVEVVLPPSLVEITNNSSSNNSFINITQNSKLSKMKNFSITFPSSSSEQQNNNQIILLTGNSSLDLSSADGSFFVSDASSFSCSESSAFHLPAFAATTEKARFVSTTTTTDRNFTFSASSSCQIVANQTSVLSFESSSLVSISIDDNSDDHDGTSDELKIEITNTSNVIYNFNDARLPTVKTLPCGYSSCEINFAGQNNNFTSLALVQLSAVSSSSSSSISGNNNTNLTTISITLDSNTNIFASSSSSGKMLKIVDAAAASSPSCILSSLSVTAPNGGVSMVSSSIVLQTPIVNTVLFDLGPNSIINSTTSASSPLVLDFSIPSSASSFCSSSSSSTNSNFFNSSQTKLNFILRDSSVFNTFNGAPLISDKSSNLCTDQNAFYYNFDLQVKNSSNIHAEFDATRIPSSAYLFSRDYVTTVPATQRNTNRVVATIDGSSEVKGNLMEAISFGNYVEGSSFGQNEFGEMSLTISGSSKIHQTCSSSSPSAPRPWSILQTVSNLNNDSSLIISSSSSVIIDCSMSAQVDDKVSLTKGAAPSLVEVSGGASVQLILPSSSSQTKVNNIINSNLPNFANTMSVFVKDSASSLSVSSSSNTRRISLLNLEDPLLSFERISVFIQNNALVNFTCSSGSLGLFTKVGTSTLLPSTPSSWNTKNHVYYSLTLEKSSRVILESAIAEVDFFSIFDNNAIVNLSMSENSVTSLSAGGLERSHFFQFGEIVATANYGINIHVFEQSDILLVNTNHLNGTTHLLYITASQPNNGVDLNDVNVKFENGINITHRCGLQTTSPSLSQVVSKDNTKIVFGPGVHVDSIASVNSLSNSVERAFDFIAVQSSASSGMFRDESSSTFAVVLNRVSGTIVAPISGAVRAFGKNIYTKICNQTSLSTRSTQIFDNTPTGFFVTVAENTTLDVIDNNNNNNNINIIHPKSVSFAEYHLGSKNMFINIQNSSISLNCSQYSSPSSSSDDLCENTALTFFDSIMRNTAVDISSNSKITSFTHGNRFSSFTGILVKRASSGITSCDGSNTVGDVNLTIDQGTLFEVSYDGPSSSIVPPARSSVSIFKVEDQSTGAECILARANGITFNHFLPSSSSSSASSPPPLTSPLILSNSFVGSVSFQDSTFNVSSSDSNTNFDNKETSMTLYLPDNSVVYALDYLTNTFYCGSGIDCWFMNVSIGGMYPNQANFIQNEFWGSSPSSSSSLQLFSDPETGVPAGKKAKMDCNRWNGTYFDPYKSVPITVTIQLPIQTTPCPTSSTTTSTTTTIAAPTTTTNSTTAPTTNVTTNTTTPPALSSSTSTTTTTTITTSPPTVTLATTSTTTQLPVTLENTGESVENAEKVADGTTAAVTATSGLTSVFSFSSVGPNVATVASRAGMTQRLVVCKPSLDEPLPFYMSPISLEIQLTENNTDAYSTRFHVGGILANLGLVFGMLFLSFLLAFVHHYIFYLQCSSREELLEEQQYEADQRINGKENLRRGTFGLHIRSLGVARIPGTTLYPTLFFCQAIIGSSLVCFVHGGLRPAVLGVGALTIVFLMIVYFLVVVGKTHQFFSTFRTIEQITKIKETRKKKILQYHKQNKNENLSLKESKALDKKLGKLSVTESCYARWIEGLNGKWFDVPIEFEYLTYDQRATLPLQLIDKDYYKLYYENFPEVLDDATYEPKEDEKEKPNEIDNKNNNNNNNNNNNENKLSETQRRRGESTIIKPNVIPASFASAHHSKRYGSLFDSYKGSTRWFVIIEIGMCAVLGIIDGLAEVIGCDESILLLAILFGVYLLSLIVLRPYCTRFHMFFGFMITLCQFVAVLVAVVPEDQFVSADTGDIVAIAVSTGSIFLALCQAAILVLQDGLRFVMDALQRNTDDSLGSSKKNKQQQGGDSSSSPSSPLYSPRGEQFSRTNSGGDQELKRFDSSNNNNNTMYKNHHDEHSAPLLRVPEREHNNNNNNNQQQQQYQQQQNQFASTNATPQSSPKIISFEQQGQEPRQPPPLAAAASTKDLMRDLRAEQEQEKRNQQQQQQQQQQPPLTGFASVTITSPPSNNNNNNNSKPKPMTTMLEDSMMNNSDSDFPNSNAPTPSRFLKTTTNDPQMGVRRPSLSVSLQPEELPGGDGDHQDDKNKKKDAGRADSISILGTGVVDHLEQRKMKQMESKYDQDDLDVL